MPTTTFDPTEGPSAEQQAAEAAALAQGEKLAEAAQEDLERRVSQTERENEDVSLIGGKFKSQDDLLKAYEELQRKLGSSEPEEGNEGSEEQEEAPEKEPVSESEERFVKASKLFADEGKLNDETIEELAQMDSKDLIKAYVDFYSKSMQAQQQQALNDQAQADIFNSVGGEKAYGEMVSWAAENLSKEEIDNFNVVTSSGNLPAIRFAVEALQNRYKSTEGFEGQMVTGKKASNAIKGYRSQAELARDIANPLYHSDPAFRADVEARLANTKDML